MEVEKMIGILNRGADSRCQLEENFTKLATKIVAALRIQNRSLLQKPLIGQGRLQMNEKTGRI